MNPEIKTTKFFYLTLVPTVIACVWTVWFLYNLAFANRHTTAESAMQALTILLSFVSLVCAVQALRTSSQKVALGAATVALACIGLIGGYSIGMIPRPDYGGKESESVSMFTQKDTQQQYDACTKLAKPDRLSCVTGIEDGLTKTMTGLYSSILAQNKALDTVLTADKTGFFTYRDAYCELNRSGLTDQSLKDWTNALCRVQLTDRHITDLQSAYWTGMN